MMNEEELAVIIENHGKWLRGEGGERANLRGANLSDANLRGANLSDANLSDADLLACAGERNYIKSIFVSDVYAITYTSESMQIGCQRHKISEWWGFDDRRIAEMDGKKALKFWREWKDTIRIIIEKSPALGVDTK